jgi:DNA-3-methyladenine glycosylase I
MSEIFRCPWAESSELMRQYHDHEWSNPVHDDRMHFEFMVLDAFQAGLSWSTILNKRENFRYSLDNFDPDIIANYDERKINELLEDSGIIRNRLKILATINNAREFLNVRAEYGSFDRYIWKFTDGTTIINNFDLSTGIPPSSKESDAMSKDLKKRGFKFCGSTICYAYMQAAGMVNDHLVECFKHQKEK